MGATRVQALRFADDLPNFICTQTTRRYFDASGTGSLRLRDTIEAELSFNQKKESYSQVRVNGRAVSRRFESLGGTLSVGEFGSILRALLVPEVPAVFGMDREELLRGRSTKVVAFSVPQASSQWTLSFKNTHSLRIAYHGWLWVDPETHYVLKIVQQADNLPPGFPIAFSQTTTEFEVTAIRGIEGQSYLLPQRAEVIIQEAQPRSLSRNVIEFRDFRRFTAEVKLNE